MRVDLPAPFWPISATTSPGEIDRLTSSTARMPGNRFDMFRAVTTAAPEATSPEESSSSCAAAPGIPYSPAPTAASLADRFLVGGVLVNLVDVQPVLVRAHEVRHLLRAHQTDRRLDPWNVGRLVVDLVGGADVLALGHRDCRLGSGHRHLIGCRPHAAEHAALDDRLRRGKLHVLAGDRNGP